MPAKIIYEKLLASKNITPKELEIKAHLGNGAVGKAIKRDSTLSLDTVNKLITAFPDLNKTYLLTGEGEMMASVNTSNQGNEKSSFTGEEIADFIAVELKKKFDDQAIGHYSQASLEEIIKQAQSNILSAFQKINGTIDGSKKQDILLLRSLISNALEMAIETAPRESDQPLEVIAKRLEISPESLSKQAEEKGIKPSRILESGNVKLTLYWPSDFEKPIEIKKAD